MYKYTQQASKQAEANQCQCFNQHVLIIKIFFFCFFFFLDRQKLCTERQFQCKSGECIPIKYTCDGEPDCQDRSDEDPTECANKGESNINYAINCQLNIIQVPRT